MVANRGKRVPREVAFIAVLALGGGGRGGMGPIPATAAKGGLLSLVLFLSWA